MNDLKQLGDRLEELANPPGARAAEDIFDAAVDESATRAGGTPSRRRHSALLVAAAIVLVAGFVSLQVWEGDEVKLVTTPAGPTEVSPKPPVGQTTAAPGSTSPSTAPTAPLTSDTDQTGPTRFDPGWTDLPSAPSQLSPEVVALPKGSLGLYRAPEPQDGSEPFDQPIPLAGGYYNTEVGAWVEVGPPNGVGPVNSNVTAVWTGREVLIVGSAQGSGGLVVVGWMPGEARFRQRAAPVVEAQLADRYSQIRLTKRGDHVMLLLSNSVGVSEVTHQLWEYDPAVDSWARLVDPPNTSDRVFGFEWSGEQLFVVSGVATAMESLYNGIEVHAFRPDEDRWTVTSPPPELSGQAAGSVWDGERLVVVSYDASAAAYDPTTDSWTRLEALPVDTGEDIPTVMALGDGTVVTLLFGQVVSLPAGRTEGWETKELPTPGPWFGSAWGQSIVFSGFNTEQENGGSDPVSVLTL